MRNSITIGLAGVAGAVFGLIAFGATTPDPAKAGKPRAEGDIFASLKVLRIQITIPPSGMAALRNTGWGRGQERPAVAATVREGGSLFTNVSVHLKGSAGSFRPVDDDPCFTLNFEKLAPGQTFHGLRKFSLNNSVQDPSFLTEKICRELFEAAGVPVPRAGHATVTLNGRDLGLHVLTEGFNKQFLKRYFKNTKGNLYDGGFVQDITARLAVNSGDNPKDHPGLTALIAAVREPDPARRLARLEQVLDMDRFLSFIAMDVMQCDWDGYAMNRNNWRLFHDLGANKMIFFPHGLDQMFGVERASPDCPIVPYMEGVVARAVVGTPEGRRRYLEKMSQLYTNVFHVDALLRRVDEVAATIRPAIAESDPQDARRHDQEVRWLKARITQRDESLRRQLSALAAMPKFDANGALRLTGWKPRAQTGAPAFQEPQAQAGDAFLYIGAWSGNPTGSWRTKFLLEPGTYRFEAKVRTKDVKPRAGEAGAGAGLRVSGGAMAFLQARSRSPNENGAGPHAAGDAVPQGLAGSIEWRNLTLPFQVPEWGSEVEFICELRAAVGEVWFDLSSLRIVRLR